MNKLLIIATLSAIAFGQVILTAALEKPHQQSAAPPNDSHIAVIISHLRKPNLYPNVTEKLCGSHSWYELETNEDGSNEPKRYIGCDIRVYEEIPPPTVPKPPVCDPFSSGDRC